MFLLFETRRASISHLSVSLAAQCWRVARRIRTSAPRHVSCVIARLPIARAFDPNAHRQQAVGDRGADELLRAGPVLADDELQQVCQQSLQSSPPPPAPSLTRRCVPNSFQGHAGQHSQGKALSRHAAPLHGLRQGAHAHRRRRARDAGAWCCRHLSASGRDSSRFCSSRSFKTSRDKLRWTKSRCASSPCASRR